MATRDLDPATVHALAAVLEDFVAAAARLGVKAALVVIDWGDGSSVVSVASRLDGAEVAIRRMAQLAHDAPEAVAEWSDRMKGSAGGVIAPPAPRGVGGSSN